MKRNHALKLAIAALQHEYRRWLYASDSGAADKKRMEINKAIVVLDSLSRQKTMFGV